MSNKKKKRKITLEEYNKAMEEYNRKARKRFIKTFVLFLILFVLLFACIIALIQFADLDADTDALVHTKALAMRILVPSIIFLILFSICLAFFTYVQASCCPKCRKIFSRGELVEYTSQQGTTTGITSGGDYYFRSSTTLVYWTECKYCGHIIWVVKG